MGQNTDFNNSMSAQRIFGAKLSRDLDLKGISVPLGARNSGVVIHCEELRVVSKEMGMVKIGLIPELSITGMSWEVRGPIAVSEWCALIRAYFQNEPLMSQSHFKDFLISFDWITNCRLKAQKANIEFSRKTLHLENLTLELADRHFQFAQGDFILEGARVGKLALASGRKQRLEIDFPASVLPQQFLYLYDENEKNEFQ